LIGSTFLILHLAARLGEYAELTCPILLPHTCRSITHMDGNYHSKDLLIPMMDLPTFT